MSCCVGRDTRGFFSKKMWFRAESGGGVGLPGKDERGRAGFLSRLKSRPTSLRLSLLLVFPIFSSQKWTFRLRFPCRDRSVLPPLTEVTRIGAAGRFLQLVGFWAAGWRAWRGLRILGEIRAAVRDGMG